MERIEIVNNSTGKVLFTLTTGTDESTYTLRDTLGMEQSVSIYRIDKGWDNWYNERGLMV